MYLYVPIDAWDILQKTKTAPAAGTTAEAAPGRVGRDERGEARRANSTPNGGPYLMLGRLRVKTWSKSGFSIAERTWPTYLYIVVYSVVVGVKKPAHRLDFLFRECVRFTGGSHQ